VDVDVAISDEKTIMVEVKSHVRPSDVYTFKRKTELCEKLEGKTKTQVMYRITLSFKQLNDYLGLLLHANLLKEKNEGRTTLKTTEKGRSLLKAYKKLKHLLKEKQI